ncbi:MAG: hypothetical protein N2450_03810 [bacterium]|nr:hypothetical protein [bacterium]
MSTRVSLSPTLNLIPPYNDILRIIIGNSIDFMMYDYPCPSGGDVKVETARFVLEGQECTNHVPYLIPGLNAHLKINCLKTIK